MSISKLLGDSDFHVNFMLTHFAQCTKYESQKYASIQKAKDVCRTNSECLGIEDLECRDTHGLAHGCNEVIPEDCIKKKGKFSC